MLNMQSRSTVTPSDKPQAVNNSLFSRVRVNNIARYIKASWWFFAGIFSGSCEQFARHVDDVDIGLCLYRRSVDNRDFG